MHRLWNVLTIIVGLWIGLGCGGDTDDRMVRRYAGCMTDTNTTLHRMTVSNALGTVPLSAEAMEERLRGSTGAGGVHHGEDQGRLRPLLQIGAVESCWKERGRKAHGAGCSPVSEWSPQGCMPGALWWRRNALRRARNGWLERRPGGG